LSRRQISADSRAVEFVFENGVCRVGHARDERMNSKPGDADNCGHSPPLRLSTGRPGHARAARAKATYKTVDARVIVAA
jgi:hypothetical protein